MRDAATTRRAFDDTLLAAREAHAQGPLDDFDRGMYVGRINAIFSYGAGGVTVSELCAAQDEIVAMRRPRVPTAAHVAFETAGHAA